MDADMPTRMRSVETRIERHEVLIETLERELQMTRTSMATRELVEVSISALAAQLSATEDAVTRDLAAQKNELGRDIKALNKRFDADVTPIKKGVSRLVWLIITAIVGVLLAIAFKGLPFP